MKSAYRAREMDMKRCSNGRQKRQCVECNPCPHGELKRFCAQCNPCTER